MYGLIVIVWLYGFCWFGIVVLTLRVVGLMLWGGGEFRFGCVLVC